jgi:hypothetical protein
MSTPRQELRRQVERASGAGVAVELQPPLTEDEIAILERTKGAIPGEIRELLSYSGGFTLEGFGAVDFRGETPFEFEAVPKSLPLSTDRRGNFWVLDVRNPGEWHPVFYILHDPPVVVIQAPDIVSFIAQVFGVIDGRPPQEVTSTHVKEISRRNPHVMSRGGAIASGDREMRAFAETLTDDFVIADLRDEQPGEGFVWGLAGPNTELRRAADGLIIATQRKAPGLLSRLFRR